MGIVESALERGLPVRLGQTPEHILAGEGQISGKGVIGLWNGVLILLVYGGFGSSRLCRHRREGAQGEKHGDKFHGVFPFWG